MLSIFKNIGSSIQRRKRTRRAIQELSGLTDRQLADLGIARSDIVRLAKQNANRVY